MRNKYYEIGLINSRNKILVFVYLLMLLFVVVNIFKIQVINHEKYKSSALENVKEDSKYPSMRGSIYDRDGKIISYSRPVYSFVFNYNTGINLERFKKEVGEFLINSEYKGDINSLLDKLSDGYKKRKDVVILEDFERSEVFKALRQVDFFDNIDLVVNYERVYNYPESFFHMAGYESRVSKDDLQSGKAEGYRPDDFIGKTGLESFFEKELRGDYGIISNYLDARGNIKFKKIDTFVKDGVGIKTTFDTELQDYIYKLMDGKKGSVVVVNPNNGEVLASLSAPSFNSSAFNGRLSQEQVDYMYSYKKPLYNRSLNQAFPPGSTIKPFLALAALEGNYIKLEDKVYSPEVFKHGNHTYRGWKKGGQGSVDVKTSIESSADVFFYKMGLEMGVDYMSSFLSKMGFGTELGINEYSTTTGNLPTKKWKKIKKSEDWRDGDSILMAIGQGFLTVSNYQLAMATSMLVNGGVLYKPMFLLNQKPKVLSKIKFKKENIEEIKEGMKRVIYGERGTARMQQYRDKFNMAGKTGTAQVVSTYGIDKDKLNSEEVKEIHKDHSIFIGFAPFENPEVVVSVFVENGGHGSEEAAPMARKIINFYLNKKRGEK